MGSIKKYKGAIFLILSLLIYAVFMSVTHIGCPIKFLFGISCPGCGMTRALYSVVILDFAAAFEFHPLWPLVPIFILLYLLLYIKGKRRGLCLLLVCSFSIFLTVYFIRLASPHDAVVTASFEDGLLYRLIRLITGQSLAIIN